MMDPHRDDLDLYDDDEGYSDSDGDPPTHAELEAIGEALAVARSPHEFLVTLYGDELVVP